jgi:hypothetical protein
MASAQQAAGTLFEEDNLVAYVTNYAFRQDGLLASLLWRVAFETWHEMSEWKERTSECDAYFDRKCPERQERGRCAIALADVIIANSSLTAGSNCQSVVSLRVQTA